MPAGSSDRGLVASDPGSLEALLRRAGFVAAREEAAELMAHAAGDAERLEMLVKRRLSGEPLAWIIGKVLFCGLEIRVDPGVYVPRWQSEPLALRTIARLPANGVAIDLCTGAGAIARTLAASRPEAGLSRPILTSAPLPVRRATGWRCIAGDLFTPLPGRA